MIKFFDFKVRGFSNGENDGKFAFEKGDNVSGHASTAELLKIVEDIDPEIVLPLYTEDSESPSILSDASATKHPNS